MSFATVSYSSITNSWGETFCFHILHKIYPESAPVYNFKIKISFKQKTFVKIKIKLISYSVYCKVTINMEEGTILSCSQNRPFSHEIL